MGFVVLRSTKAAVDVVGFACLAVRCNFEDMEESKGSADSLRTAHVVVSVGSNFRCRSVEVVAEARSCLVCIYSSMRLRKLESDFQVEEEDSVPFWKCGVGNVFRCIDDRCKAGALLGITKRRIEAYDSSSARGHK